ncbi:MAG: MmcQ/YjbR family DNA-binding protein [Asticcacaulis sp.]|nr:MmcQ/YjbR family DNA-binding protein [Asticcacaulis sp.]
MITYETLRDIALGWPGVEEGVSWGTPTLKVGKKAMFYWNPDHDVPVFKVGYDERDFLLEADPESFFTTDHHRPWPVILARPDKVDVGWVRENLRRVWRAQCPKKLLKAHDAEFGAV